MTVTVLRPGADGRAKRVPPAAHIIRVPGPFAMRRGGDLPEVDIAFESWGSLSPARDNTVLLFTGLSPNTHAASSSEDPSPGWWEYMIGPGKPINTDRFHVVCVNSLGSCFGSTGPASLDPRTGKPYRLTFPELSVEDIANAARQALRAIGIKKVRAVIGASLGGMSALTYSVQFPDEVEALMSISAATRAAPFAIAIRSLQREIVRSDASWKDGNYESPEGPVVGMRLARKLGLTSYRSAQEWQQRFARERAKSQHEKPEPFGIEFEVEAYLDYNARKFIDSFDANCYLYLSRAMDIFDLAEHGGTVEAALSRIDVKRVLVMGVDTDLLFPMQQQEELAATLYSIGINVTFAPLPSYQGHDSFLVDKERFAPVVRDFFAEL